jgi:hypothetical protein
MDWDVRNKPVATTAAPRSNGFSKMSSPGLFLSSDDRRLFVGNLQRLYPRFQV